MNTPKILSTRGNHTPLSGGAGRESLYFGAFWRLSRAKNLNISGATFFIKPGKLGTSFFLCVCVRVCVCFVLFFLMSTAKVQRKEANLFTTQAVDRD